MVADVGLAMRDAWQGKLAANALVQRALRYIVHPDDIDMRDAPGPGQVAGQIQSFADSNPAVVRSLDFATSKARFLAEAHAERERQLNDAREMFARNDANADRTSELTALV